MGGTASRARAWATIASCFVVALFEGIELQSAGVAAPGLGAEFHLDPQQLGLFFSASTFGLLFGAAVGGRIADRVGRKAVLVVSVAVFGLFSLLTVFAWDAHSLVAARLLTGLGIGGAMPNLVALAAENSEPGARSRAVALMYSGLPLGGALVSLVSLWGAGAEGWRAIFAIGGIAPLLALPLLLRFLPESGEFLASHQEKPPLASALFGEQRRYATPLLWTSFFFTLLVLYLLLNWLPSLLVDKGLSPRQAGLVQAVFNVAGALGAVWAGALLDRRGGRLMVATVYIVLAVGLLLLAGAGANLGFVIALGATVGVGAISSQAILYALAPNYYATSYRGTGVGAAVSAGRMGSVAGPMVAAALIGAGGGPAQVLSGLLPFVCVAALASLVLVWRREWFVSG